MHNTKYFDPNRHATWLECFFDLIFVVAIDDVTHIPSHTHEGHLDPLQFWKFVLVFIPLWWIRASHTIYDAFLSLKYLKVAGAPHPHARERARSGSTAVKR